MLVALIIVIPFMYKDIKRNIMEDTANYCIINSEVISYEDKNIEIEVLDSNCNTELQTGQYMLIELNSILLKNIDFKIYKGIKISLYVIEEITGDDYSIIYYYDVAEFESKE